MIKIENLFFSYGDESIFNGAEVHIETQKICALIGKNGVGKTTLFNLIKHKNKTAISYNGQVTHMAQNTYLPNRMTVLEVMKFIQLLNNYKDNFIIHTIMAISGRPECSVKRYQSMGNKQVHFLSNGELKWLSVLIALSNDNDIFLLDEPTDGVDPEYRLEIWNCIKNKSRLSKSTFIVSSHLISEMVPYVDEILFIHNKQISIFEDINSFNKTFGGSHADESFVNAYSL